MQVNADSLNASCVSTHQRHQQQHPYAVAAALSGNPTSTIPHALGNAMHQAAGEPHTSHHASDAYSYPYAAGASAGGRGPVPHIVVLGTAAPQPTDHREAQRRQILDHVNELLKFCNIPQSKGVTNIRQCSSSFFVLLYQRLFDCTIEDIDRSPNTLEKKRRNVSLVLNELRSRHYNLDDISAEEVVRLNEDHISRLIMVFVSIAAEMSYERERAAGDTQLYAHGATAPPPGYTVAEVAARTTPSSREGGNGYHHLHQTNEHDDDTIEAPPSSGYESPSGEGSYYMEDSAIPTEELVKSWYREIVSPDASVDSPNMKAGAHATPVADARRRQRLHQQQQQQQLLDTTDCPKATGGDRPAPTRSISLTTPASSQRRAAPARAVGSNQRPAKLTSQAPHAAGRHHLPAATAASSSAALSSVQPEEPPLTRAECRLLSRQPYRLIDREARDRKIERLRTARFLADMQDMIRQRMRREYDECMSDMRTSFKESMSAAQQERVERKRRLREESEKYRRAYAVLMESASNDVRVPKYMMSSHTAQLAGHYAASLEESRRMCEYLRREGERRNLVDVMHYAENVSAWQQRMSV